VLILEYTQGTYEGNAWARIKARSGTIANDQILAYKVDVKKAGDLSKYKDKIVEATFDVVKGASDSAVLKVVEVSE